MWRKLSALKSLAFAIKVWEPVSPDYLSMVNAWVSTKLASCESMQQVHNVLSVIHDEFPGKFIRGIRLSQFNLGLIKQCWILPQLILMPRC